MYIKLKDLDFGELVISSFERNKKIILMEKKKK